MYRIKKTHDEQNSVSRRASIVALYYLLPILTTSVIVWAVLHTWHLQLSPPTLFHTTHAHRWTTCGSSPAEAESRGCRFDILSFAWQTPECYDDELMQEFIHYDTNNTWQFYAHPNNRTVVVDLATALRGHNRTLYVDWKYHVTHCTFTWRQMHRAYALRGYIDSHLDSYRHTLHCQWVLLENGKTPMETVNVVAELKYPECRKIGGEGRRPMGVHYIHNYSFV
ncbi:hypothetical protein C8A03DRAFT_48111 [Achaetomium macrosporum]|uniref:Uncharacterized protein n=1 Tax=Achaetomium macrosporum TaxID=79813 RepID=A0AAN7C116_9PEZI|nr:hypothetical protein C8A03DRAFT_48111 [Achaetomium macrosporum]